MRARSIFRVPAWLPGNIPNLLLPLLSALPLTMLPDLAHGQTAREERLREQLVDIVDSAGLSDAIGLLVADTHTGREIFQRNSRTPRNPASNMKVLTAATALHELGPQFRMDTVLRGTVEEKGRVPLLVLEGEGNPELSLGDLLELAGQLKRAGVRRVARVVVDGSYFDDQVLPPSFEKQPGEMAAFRAPVAAVSVNRNAYRICITPVPGDDAPQNVLLEVPGYFDVDDEGLEATASGPPNIFLDQRAGNKRLKLKLRGTVPLNLPRGRCYRRRVHHPHYHAGHAMLQALHMQDIAAPAKVEVGRASEELPTLARHKSPPLSILLQRVGKNSDNFVAEMLLKVVGREATSKPGSSQAGAQRVIAFLTRIGTDPSSARVVNGSGLFEGNSVSPEHLVKTLVEVQQNPALQHEFMTQLAIGGVDGTLRNRMKDLPAFSVRAKTGTLRDVIALSGYAIGDAPGESLSFSFLLNGVRGKHWPARKMLDDMVKALVKHLHEDGS